MRQGFLIPIYRHGKTAIIIAQRLESFNLPVILVDDGNDSETRTLLAEYAAHSAHTVLISLKKNMGKGGAVIAGIEKASELGLSHVLQTDADGQHDIERAAFFLEESAQHPDNIICGFPEFDENAPKSRVRGRKISNFWAAITTLSSEMKDMHCGFRVYPVEQTLRITRRRTMEKRMGFDTEILVRLYWNRVFPLYYPIKINYPENGISNFHIVGDNIRVSWTFCRLCIGMFIRLPRLIAMQYRRRMV